MLSDKNADVIRATLPVVGENLGPITERFYRKLFAAAPVLERDVFNRSNQARGEQQRALAGAVAQFATLLIADTDTDPRETIGRIANKHASLGVLPAHYEVVHTHLFAAIVEVLGDAVTEDVAGAWDAVYWLLADALIDAEKDLYAEAGVQAENIWKTVTVLDKQRETATVASFTLGALDGETLPPFKAGQYISVAVTLADGARQIRQYSVTQVTPSTYRITVKRESGDPEGEVSNYLHRRIDSGDTLVVSPPFGDVVLPQGDGPVVLVSAGIGNTPFVSFLHDLAAKGDTRSVTVYHADTAPSAHAHREETEQLIKALSADGRFWYEDLEGFSDEHIAEGQISGSAIEIPAGADVYLCGPIPFLDAAKKIAVAKGVDGSRIHYEVFGPDTWLGV
ncbi:globin domain-containing protein [Rhodococcus kronopolitis]|uniref:nitric oxide dioxygenase n=1 Tax=Rhodococcus kronopolitis TaxID=1460226 RepID=A0ABV9FSA6_9NOCA